MKKILLFINIFRSIPAIILYFIYPQKHIINEDIKNNSYIFNKTYTSTIWALNELLFRNRVFRNIFYYRIKLEMGILADFFRIFYPIRNDIEIYGNILGGLTIFHGSSIIAPYSAGENLSVWQHVTIGRIPNGELIDRPIIGNNVKIYTGAIVIGKIVIGNNVSIGAGSVVTKSVPDNCVVVGNPAKIVRKDGIKVNIELK